VWSFLADLILILHFAYVAFVVVGLFYICVGWALHWSGIRNPTFRTLHLAAMALVVAESCFGVFCPLTEWEGDLRVRAGGGGHYQGSFLQHWVHRVLFYELSARTFQIVYALVLAVIIAAMVVAPPRWWPAPRWWSTRVRGRQR
jgi:hypothetical protein